ncbi:unnamed protein product [Candidula unifasciata]|uniref:Nuclear receptor coactivator 6 TRADD-N domain-containing protein n=1 Tax=Candidula unifasciata TaxID=100452 RepID=A0A8S3YWG5_9EUPU|nr:unnamed protein product [Candidula unifasciata]
MDGAMGQEEDVVEAVLTCEGDFHDPELSIRIERFRHRLKDLLLTEKQRLQVKKIEPWNSVKVTVTIPRAAAIRLRQLAQNGNDALRQMGVLSVQIQGDTQISLTIAGRNNEPTQLLLRTQPVSQAGNSSLPLSAGGSDSGIQNSEDYGSPQGSSSDDLTRRNIVNYLRQGSGLRQNAIFDSILGSATSSVPALSFDLDLPQSLDSVAGPSGSSTVFRPNSIVSTSLQSSSLKGSNLNSSFPFTKTPGAFHPPVSRLSSSAGQSSATNSTHHLQPVNGRLVGSLGHDTQNTQQSLSSPAPSAHMFQHNMNTFNPVSALRLSPAASSAHVNALPLHVPPSSPTPSFMIDLPPPPPYPSSSNANRQGKPVTSSSPLLVNLLQTDPLMATVGLASGHPNKPLAAGDFNSGSPSKKRRPKKQKDGVMKAYLTDSAVSGRAGVHSWLFPSDVSVEHSNSRVTESSATSLDFMPSRTDMLAASHIADSFMLKPLPDCKPSFLSDRPGSESHIGSPSDEFHSDFSSRSAIGTGYSSSNISDSNGQDPFPKDLDPFSMEIAAGKIINPYTGHLEPRDSTMDSMQVRHFSSLSSSQIPHAQATNRMKIADTSHFPPNHNSQAASSEMVTPLTNQILLNSLPHKHADSQNGTSSPADNKTSSEGDENSNHSQSVADTLPEHAGAVVLLEHSSVKAENHDSGIGSSSERSDDTPSEPGDAEFRSGQSGAEVEDGSKASVQKPVNCKLESKVNSSSNTITVGYMMNPSDSAAQPKLTQITDVSHTSKNSVVVSTSAVTDISHFFHTHVMSMGKQAGILTGSSQSSMEVGVEDSKGQPNHSLPGRLRENGQSPEDLGNTSSGKVNGPSSQSSIEKMVKAAGDKQHKKIRSSPKQNSKKGLMDVSTEHQKLQAEVLERLGKLHQSTESAKESSHVMSVKANSLEKAGSPDALSQRLNSSEDRPDQIIFDMEELVNGRITGSGSSGAESRGGSNITSIYSKRSSPVNVNMLNHIYAPGLPLPRRLTESVQRLVKPLPAAETSVSYSQMRPCKSPGSGGSPRAGSGVGIQSSLRMSGVRSPGASMPKLVASDKHSLLSGGLDLAGLTNLQFASTTSERTDLVTCQMGSQALASDVLFQDTHCFSSSRTSPDLLDSKSYSSKMLSQSFPPHKSKDMKPNSSHTSHGLFLSLQSNSSFSEKNISSSVNTTRHTQLPKARAESSLSSSQDSRFHLSNRSHQDVLQSGHLSSISDTSQARLGSQQPPAAEPSHSAVNSHVADNSSAYTSHSNAASPVMPMLQLRQDSPVTPTTASNMPSLSSQSPSSIFTAREISTATTGSSGTTSSTQNKHVPYSITVASSGTTSNTIAKSTTLSTFLPTSFAASTAPLVLGKAEDSPSYTATRPRLSLPSELSSNSKPKKVHIPNNPSPSSRSGCSTPQFSRNLFESVSGTLTQDGRSSSKLEQASENNSLDSAGHGSVHLPVCTTDGPSDSFVSLSVSHESKGDQLVKTLRQKSVDSGDRRTAASLSQSSKADAASKSIVTSQETSLSTFLSTEVVNLDFPLPAQACDVLSLNKVSVKGSSCSGSILKTSLSVSQSLQESAHAHTSQPSTSSLSSVAAHVRTSDNLRDTQASPAVGKDDTVVKVTPGLSNSSMPLVKEPILEILASALGSSLTKTSRPGKSFVEKQISSSELTLQFHRAEEEAVTESKIVTIQSGPRRAQDYSRRQPSLDLSSSDSAAILNSDPLTRRPARKRKLTQEDDSTDEASSADPTPAKQPLVMHSLGSGIRSRAKCASADDDLTVIHSNMRTDSPESKGVHLGKCLGQKEPQEWKTEQISRVTLEAPQEEADSQNNVSRMRRTSGSENQDHNGPKETRSHRSVVSDTSSLDENLLSNTYHEVKTSALKESRLHHSAADSGSEGKERQLHCTGAASSAVEDQRLTTDGLSSPLSSVDHSENSQKGTVLQDSDSLSRTADVPDGKDDQQDNSSQLNLSLEDSADSGREVSSEKPASSDGGLSDSKLDDGQKKTHRIRRQFYAYVPEKSIDQTYFDTPILSGRTRSKNKPCDLGDAALEEAAPAASGTESHPQHPAVGQQTAPVGKAEGSAEKAGGKRPTRSVRTKDNSQEQNASKRRRVQQHR